MSASGARTLLDSTSATEPPSPSAVPISRDRRTAPRKTDSKAVDHWEVAVFLNEMSESDRRAMEEYVGTQPRQP